MLENEIIYTGERFFGKKLYIESFGDKAVNAALKSVFHDSYHRTAPLEMRREDVQILLNAEPKQGQLGLFK